MFARRSVQIWLALGAVWIVWGSTYLAIAYVVDTMPPLLSAGMRWTAAGSAMFLVARARGDRTDRPTAVHWRNAAIIGTALCLGGNGLVAIAEQRVASGTAALLVATVPLWVAGFEWIRRRERSSPAVLAGLVVGFLGTAILVTPGGAGGTDTTGAALVLAAAAIWAGGSLFSRGAALPARPLVAAGMEMLCGGLACMVAGTLGGEIARFDVGAISASSVVALIYLAVFGSIIGFSSYVWTFRNVPTSLATTYAYVNPLIAVVLGAVIAGERLTGTTLAGGLVIVMAVAIIVTASGGSRRRVRARTTPDLAADEVLG